MQASLRTETNLPGFTLLHANAGRGELWEREGWMPRREWIYGFDFECSVAAEAVSILVVDVGGEVPGPT